MSEQVKKPVRITETVLRDAHQSLITTRMPTEVMPPIADKMDQVGYEAVEMWGGATFDSCLRFLKEEDAQAGFPQGRTFGEEASGQTPLDHDEAPYGEETPRIRRRRGTGEGYHQHRSKV